MSHQSSLNWLEVKGVRSFDPRKTSKIEFGKPLTLLHGPNGAGKTPRSPTFESKWQTVSAGVPPWSSQKILTIIESLNYAITGSLPPNSRGNFIHDPKLLKRKSVEALITLCYTSISKQERQLSVKPSGSTTGGGSAWLSTTHADGRKSQERTVKRNDAKVEVTDDLGVSEDVLKHVTFCHHDNANWPLTDTSKDLKEKFDKIFDLSKYESAIKDISNTKKKKEREQYTANFELPQLEEKCKIAADKKHQLKTAKEQNAKDEKQINELRSQITAKDTKIRELEKLLDDINTMKLERRTLRDKKEQITKSKTELENKLKSYNENASKRKIASLTKNIENLEKKVELKGKELVDLRNEMNKLKLLEGTLSQKLSEAKTRYLEEFNGIAQMCGKYGCPVPKERLRDFHKVLTISPLAEKLCDKLDEIFAQGLEKNEAQKAEINSSLKPIEDKLQTVLKETIQLEENCGLRKKFAKDLDEKQSKVLNEINALQKTSRTTGNSGKLQKEVADLKQKLVTAKSSYSHEQSASMLNELQQSLEQARNVSFGSLGQALEKLRGVASSMHDLELKRNSIFQLQEQIIEKQDEIISCNKLISMREKYENTSDELSSLRELIKQDEENLISSQSKFEAVEKEKEEKLKSIDSELLEIQSKRFAILKDKDKMEDLATKFQKNDFAELQKSFEKITRDINETSTKIEELEKEKETDESDIKETQKEREQCLQEQPDAISRSHLEDYNKNLERINKEMKDVEKRLQQKKPEVAQRQYDAICKEMESLKSNLSQIRGKMSESGINKSNLENEIKQRGYEQAPQALHDKRIESVMLEMTIEDLRLYADALDYAIVEMHKNKMKEINKFVKKLWQDTYCGKDIDYIEVCCDVKNRTGKRREFNYRVVMYLNEVKMDMKGRCSAGQKVLASLVIRLALAEVFCRKCAVLALDEPTANLDKHNMDSFVDSLLNVVQSRSQRSNLQLIIITHDKRLLEKLGMSSYADHYYQIRKDPKTGCSSVKQHDIKELND